MSGETTLSLGEYLRQERERRGITIEQVASASKIGVKTLHSLESDHYADLPAKPFVRGFVSSYCRFIGLDPKETLTRFGDYIEDRALDRPSREGGHSGYAFEKRDGDQSRTVLWMVMGSFVVAGGLAAVFIKKPLGHHSHSHADKLRAAYGVAASPVPGASILAIASPSPVSSILPVLSEAAVPQDSLAAPSPMPEAASLPSPSPSPFPLPSPATSLVPSAEIAADEGPSAEDPLNSGVKLKASEIKYRVVFKAIESAWVRYQCDHRPVTTFVFRTGKTLVLRARESIEFQVSPPKALTFNYKGDGFKPLVGNPHLVTRQNDATLFFPFELADSIEKPFDNEKPLSSRSVPPPRLNTAPPPSSP